MKYAPSCQLKTKFSKFSYSLPIQCLVSSHLHIKKLFHLHVMQCIVNFKKKFWYCNTISTKYTERQIRTQKNVQSAYAKKAYLSYCSTKVGIWSFQKKPVPILMFCLCFITEFQTLSLAHHWKKRMPELKCLLASFSFWTMFTWKILKRIHSH